MEKHNQTSVQEFVLLGFSDEQSTNLCLFAVFLFVYLFTLAGNTLIITAIHVDPRLNTPMYFFLSNLSFLDICYTTSIIPQFLAHLWTSHKIISFHRCMAQLFILLSLGGTECCLLAAMAYDRYVAICHPLRYMVIISRRMCLWLVLASWMSGFFNGLMQTICTIRVDFCRINTINHLFCELKAILKVACSDTTVNDITILVAGFIWLLIPCNIVLLSYVYIIRTILRIRSSEGRQKAFSTCTSHIIVVTLFYGTVIFAYMSPKAYTSPNQDKIFTVIYTVITPMFNPVIYSLRNKEVKEALAKAVRKTILLEKQ